VNEVQELMQLMDKVDKIVHIVGPPGFGKSTLAICVGNAVISKGIVVRYINMAEITHQPIQQVMAEKVLYQESTHSDMTNVTFDHLLSWSGRRYWQNLIIFDNCDELLNNQRDQFNEAIEIFVKQSNSIKVLVTSREESLFVETSRAVKVDSLSINETCDLLDQKSPSLLSVNEKIAIANLTGNVPLALQIVGSLLNKRLNPPTPYVIIEELKLHPIPTLSPPDLHRKMRINASISVSYNYLEPRLKKLARCLANFPGSFTESMASAVLKSVSSNIFQITEDYVHSSLGKLVTRSLLEYNPLLGRYHFHHLLREFFRDVQLQHHREERGKFALAFQTEMSTVLRGLTEIFVESPKKALSVLESERHNVRHLLKITARPYNCSHKAYSAAIAAIDHAITVNFLPCRFSTEELYEPVSGITFVMKNKANRSETDTELDVVSNSIWYVHFIIHHARLLSKLKGMEAAAKWFMTNVVMIENVADRLLINPDLQRRMATLYTKFYMHLLTYGNYIDEERVRVYNTRILQKTIQILPNAESDRIDFSCERTTKDCPYQSIATAYYSIKEYEKSIQFLEKALELEGLGVNDYVTLSIRLVISYSNIHDHDKAKDAFERTVMHIYTDVLQSPSTLVIHSYESYIRILRMFGESEKALKLERKELKELLELQTDTKAGILEGLRAYHFALTLFEQGNDTEAIAMGTLAIRLLEDIDPKLQSRSIKELHLKMMVMIGQIKHRSGNSSESEAIFMEVADWIIEQQATKEYEREYSDVCSYLIFHSKYFYECYLKEFEYVGTSIVTAGMAITYYLLIPPLDLYVQEKQSEGDLNHFEQLMSESGIKDILLRAEVKPGDFPLSTTFHYPNSDHMNENYSPPESSVMRIAKYAINFARRIVIIRAIINVLVVAFKLWSFVFTLYFMYRCLICCGCDCCFCYCRLIGRCTTSLIQYLLILYTYVTIKYFDGH
jgi:tetratricopeptide (TPR) repeat protein